MPRDKEIAVICTGPRSGALANKLIEKGDLAVSFITNNALDFMIHHADPSKILSYHLEFSNLIEQRAKKNIESLSIFETLGQFFEFYNPLRLSTLNFLISKYFTSLNPTNKNFLSTWKEISKTIFDDEFVFPLFEEIRILHVKEGEIELPVRQYVITKEIELKKENGKAQAKPKKKDKVPGNETGDELTVSGIIDLDLVDKMKACDETFGIIENAAALIIIATDVMSCFVLFQSAEFKEALKKAECEIAFISPFTPQYSISPIERDILEKSGFSPNLVNVANLVKESVDTIIIDEKDSELVGKIRETGTTVLVENLSVEAQQKDEFLERVLKSASLDLENYRIEPQEEPKFGDRLMGLLSAKFTKKDQEDEADDGQKSSKLDLLRHSSEGNDIEDEVIPDGTSPQDSIAGEKQPASNEVQGPASPVITTIDAAIPDVETPNSQPERKTKEVIPVKPASVMQAEKTTSEQKPLLKYASAKQEEIESSSTSPADVAESLQIDQKVYTSINKAIVPTYEEGIETVFSDLLEIQEQPDMVAQLFQFLANKLLKLDEFDPVKRTIDLITYLAAHNPDVYSDLCSDMFSQLLKVDDDQLRQKLDAVSLVMQASMVKKEGILTDFIRENVVKENMILLERVRKILNYFIAKDKLFEKIILKVLLELFKERVEDEEADETQLERIIFLLNLFDSFIVGRAMIENIPEGMFDKVRDALSVHQPVTPYVNVILNVIDAFQASEYEALKKALNVKKIPASIQTAILKRRYVTQLAKVGSVPLEIFAEKIGLSIDEAEKVIYDMILKGDIAAKIEIVSGRLYVVHEGAEKDLEEKKEKEKDKEKEKEKEKEKPALKGNGEPAAE